MEGTYSIFVLTDGKETWKRNYDNCVDAVNSYNKFVDHGFCTFDLTVTLVEPSGKLHTKTFLYPYSNDAERKEALKRLNMTPDTWELQIN